MLKLVSVLIIPVVISLIVANGLMKKAPVFTFLSKVRKAELKHHSAYFRLWWGLL